MHSLVLLVTTAQIPANWTDIYELKLELLVFSDTSTIFLQLAIAQFKLRDMLGYAEQQSLVKLCGTTWIEGGKKVWEHWQYTLLHDHIIL